MLSYPFWQRQFKADPAMIGQTITLGKEARSVVGVLPPDFDFGAVFAPGAKRTISSPRCRMTSAIGDTSLRSSAA
jgi:hypothetical protein